MFILNFLIFIIIALSTVEIGVNGHGMVLNPVGRSSRWRYDRTAKVNYGDNQLWCGGFYVQYLNNGQCGLCGDSFNDRTPRPNELGGTYGQGVIVGSYTSGGQLPVSVQITANHKGYFQFNLCNLDTSAETDACFQQYPLLLTNGADKYPLPSDRSGLYDVMLQLPSGLVCNHCVLQWTYTAGNNWGVCPDGRGALGCGPQEHYRTCSDIRIGRYSSSRSDLPIADITMNDLTNLEIESDNNGDDSLNQDLVSYKSLGSLLIDLKPIRNYTIV